MVDEAVSAKKLAAIRDAVLRNLIAHQYGAIDAGRIFELASNDVEDLLSLCRQLAQQVERR